MYREEMCEGRKKEQKKVAKKVKIKRYKLKIEEKEDKTLTKK